MAAMWITKTSIQNPVFATMVMVAIVVLGLASYRGLGLEAMPNIDIPGAAIEVLYPGASPEAVENDITRPIEEAVNTVSGIKTLRANSWEGRAGVYIDFELSTNMDRAMQDLRDKVAQVRPRFPKEAKDPFIVRFEGENARPVAQVALTASAHSLRDLSTLADQLVSKRFQAIPGVGQVRLNGTASRQILISLRPDDLNAQAVGVDELIAAIEASNTNLPAGSISYGASEQLVRVEGKMKQARDFNKIIVARRANGPVYLQQVATDLKKSLPPDIELTVLNDQSEKVQSQLGNVKETIIEGAVLTMVIVFFFLHSWRSTIITGLTLPISVMASFIAMKAFGFTLNFLTLMALSLCIGLLIDDAIVVRENIVRHLGMGKSHRQAAGDGTSEIGLAVMATTFAIVAVFIPVAFMQGLIGRFFLQFGVTVAVAVLVSLFVSFTLDPMLSSVWPDPVEGRFKYAPWLGRFMHWLEGGIERVHVVYGRVLALALRWRKLTLLTALLLFVGSLMLVPMIGGEMFPNTDDGWVNLRLKTPVGSSLDYTDLKVHQAEDALKAFPEIVSTVITVGTQDGRNTAQMDLKLSDRKLVKRRSQKELESLIRARLESIAGVALSVS